MNHITFRQLEEEDLPLRVRWFNNPSVGEYLGSIPDEPVTLDHQKSWFEKYQKSDDVHFIIEAGGKPIGQVALIDYEKENNFANLFIFIGEDDYRNQGIAQEAMKFVKDFGFGTLHLHKLALEVNEQNLPAIRAYQKFGFTEEARLKERLCTNGKYYDEIIMAIFNKNE